MQGRESGRRSAAAMREWEDASLKDLVLLPLLPYLCWALVYYAKARHAGAPLLDTPDLGRLCAWSARVDACSPEAACMVTCRRTVQKFRAWWASRVLMIRLPVCPFSVHSKDMPDSADGVWGAGVCDIAREDPEARLRDAVQVHDGQQRAHHHRPLRAQRAQALAGAAVDTYTDIVDRYTEIRLSSLKDACRPSLPVLWHRLREQV